MRELYAALERLVNAENDWRAHHAAQGNDINKAFALRTEFNRALAHAEITLSNYSALGRKEDYDHPNNAAGH